MSKSVFCRMLIVTLCRYAPSLNKFGKQLSKLPASVYCEVLEDKIFGAFQTYLARILPSLLPKKKKKEQEEEINPGYLMGLLFS